MILAVTGITGHTGGYFLRELIRNRFDGTLRALVRESSDTRALDASGLRVEKVVGDIKNPDDLFRLVNGADRVLHIAGIRDTLPLMEAIDRAGVKGHIVLVHTTGIYSRFRMASGEYKEIEQALQNRECECGRLPRTRLGDTQKVLAFQEARDGLFLNGGGLFVTNGADCTLEGIGQGKF